MYVIALEKENLRKDGDCNPNCKIIVLDITCPSRISNDKFIVLLD